MFAFPTKLSGQPLSMREDDLPKREFPLDFCAVLVEYGTAVAHVPAPWSLGTIIWMNRVVAG